MEWNLETIIAVVTSLTSLGLFAMLRVLVKEIKEFVYTVKKAKADKVVTEKEMLSIAKEGIDVMEQVIKIGYIFKKMFKKKK